MIVALFSWWYSAGWGSFANKTLEALRNTLDFFSMGTLLKTLFAPFRQISAGSSGAVALDDKFRAAMDKLVSRIIGAVVRIFLLLAGAVVFSLQAAGSLLLLIIWPVVPALPVAGIVMTIMGVTI